MMENFNWGLDIYMHNSQQKMKKQIKKIWQMKYVANEKIDLVFWISTSVS